jgi:hypothetical protein
VGLDELLEAAENISQNSPSSIRGINTWAYVKYAFIKASKIRGLGTCKQP